MNKSSRSVSMSSGVVTLRQTYDKMVERGEIGLDKAQLVLVKRLDELLEDMGQKRLSSKSSSLGWLFNRRKKQAPQRGLYIWGSVGRGKSMLMDLFFSLAPYKRKRRAHFNDFMQDAHERIHAHRQAFKAGETKQEDPIPPVGRDLAEEARLLCFDEFTVTDIADAMVLGRLFSVLFDEGVVVVATSNVAPDNLYKDGLNRQLFLPFIDLLKERVEEFELDARTDFRLEKLDRMPVYLSPLGDKSKAAMDDNWERLTGSVDSQPGSLSVKGRSVAVPHSAKGVARFDFRDLCDQPLGAGDYLAVARNYHTVMIDNVPIMGNAMRNQAKRFILLIDTLYDTRTKLVISAAANPHALYQATTGVEAFEFDRTASRLIEMQSKDYLAAGMGDGDTHN